jgi:hypothetical protein
MAIRLCGMLAIRGSGGGTVATLYSALPFSWRDRAANGLMRGAVRSACATL